MSTKAAISEIQIIYNQGIIFLPYSKKFRIEPGGGGTRL